MPMIDAEGKYRCKVTDKQLCESSKGTPQICLTFEVTEPGPQMGQHIMDFMALSEKALQYTVAKLRATGWQGVDLSQLETVGSRECQIVVQTDVYEGTERLRVRFVNDLDRQGPAVVGTMDTAKQKALAAKLRGMIAGLDPAQARAKPAAKPAPAGDEPPPPTDDDLPF